MNFKIMLSEMQVSKRDCEIILETFVLNTSVQEFEMLKGMLEARNLTTPKLNLKELKQ